MAGIEQQGSGCCGGAGWISRLELALEKNELLRGLTGADEPLRTSTLYHHTTTNPPAPLRQIFSLSPVKHHVRSNGGGGGLFSAARWIEYELRLTTPTGATHAIYLRYSDVPKIHALIPDKGWMQRFHGDSAAARPCSSLPPPKNHGHTQTAYFCNKRAEAICDWLNLCLSPWRADAHNPHRRRDVTLANDVLAFLATKKREPTLRTNSMHDQRTLDRHQIVVDRAEEALHSRRGIDFGQLRYRPSPSPAERDVEAQSSDAARGRATAREPLRTAVEAFRRYGLVNPKGHRARLQLCARVQANMHEHYAANDAHPPEIWFGHLQLPAFAHYLNPVAKDTPLGSAHAGYWNWL
jgi:hypothetical protein